MGKRRASRKAWSTTLRVVLDNPALPAFVNSLPPRTLARMCRRIGVPDAAAIMALAPARQLVQALDASVWRSPRPGVPEVFDPRELIDWIGTWLEIGESFAAERFAAISDEDLALYLSQVLRVSTSAMWGFERSTEIEDLDRIYAPSDEEKAYGPYVVRARRNEDWEAVRGALDVMWLDAPERLLQLFAQLTADESMLAPDANRERSNRDMGSRRESIGERQGHVTAAGARAFLAFGTRASIQELLSMSEYDLETRRHLSGLVSVEEAEPGDLRFGHTGDPLDSEPRNEERHCVTRTRHLAAADDPQMAALRSSLEMMGLLDLPADQRLISHEGSLQRLAIVGLLERLADEYPIELDRRARELAYLGSALIAGVAVEQRFLTVEQARAAALATCNLGLELLQARGERVRIEQDPGLVRLFLVGWKALGEVPGRIVNAFTGALDALRSTRSAPLHEWLVEQAETSVSELREAVAQRDFAAAREAALVLAFVFDAKVCRAIVSLLDELPRLPSDEGGPFQWIDSRKGLDTVGELLDGLRAKRRSAMRRGVSR